VPTTRKIENMIGILLLLGTIISAGLVLGGGIVYLWQHGGDNLQSELLSSDNYSIHIRQIWGIALSSTPIGFIELGLIALVGTQILRVGLLVWFYAAIRDYAFTGICIFVLVILLYSFFWQ
jgi:uncharacterized membrane protein